jgi:hypothetical protein
MCIPSDPPTRPELCIGNNSYLHRGLLKVIGFDCDRHVRGMGRGEVGDPRDSDGA